MYCDKKGMVMLSPSFVAGVMVSPGISTPSSGVMEEKGLSVGVDSLDAVEGVGAGAVETVSARQLALPTQVTSAGVRQRVEGGAMEHNIWMREASAVWQAVADGQTVAEAEQVRREQMSS